MGATRFDGVGGGLCLDQDQRRVVEHFGSPLLVLAGPGTGKTTTVIEAVSARLRGCGHEPIPPGRVLVLTLGRPAALEIRQMLSVRIGTGPVPQVATFHSFSHGLLRSRAAADGAARPFRLLTAPEQERRLRELFANSVREARVAWPEELAQALGTAGLAAELRDFIAQARILGVGGSDLEEASWDGWPIWANLAPFVAEYLDVLDAEGVVDYAELINRAAQVVAADPEPLFDAVYVDEYQDTDPAQVRLLQRLAPPGTTLVAMGDPDQSIYSFRGAEPRGVHKFLTDFAGPGRDGAELALLGQTHRFGPVIRDAVAGVVRRVPLAGLPASAQRRHRALSADDALGPGQVTVVRFASEADQALGVADLVRQARSSGDARAWSDVVVFMRSAGREAFVVAAQMSEAGIPVAVDGDDMLLREDPSLAPILALLRAAAGIEPLTGSAAVELAISPLGGMSPHEVRSVGRELRRRGPQAAADPTASADLVACAVTGRHRLKDLDGPGADRFRSLASLFARARAAIASGCPVPEVLWTVWTATDWPDRLKASALSGGRDGRASDRILDAAMALFDLAVRVEDPLDGGRGMRNFLDDIANQAVPGGAWSGHGVTRDRVLLTTAHRAKGRQWPVVVVAGVQEGSWPDWRKRPSLLGSRQLADVMAGTPSISTDSVVDERRLFYVACTRARSRLVVTCVASPDEGGPQPSRFVDDLMQVDAVSTVDWTRDDDRPTSLAEVVAQLRFARGSVDSSPALRSGAAVRLTRLWRGGADAPVPAADCRRWWGVRPVTVPAGRVDDEPEPVRLSGSAWNEIAECPLRWFLSRRAHADSARGASAAFGSFVHVLADAVGRGELPPDPEALGLLATEMWPGLAFEADWQGPAELEQVQAALRRFVEWHKGRPERVLVASEARFDTSIETPAGTIELRGSVDRVERGPDGLHVVDLKTQRKLASGAELAEHRQLALYQLAASSGALEVHGVDGELPVAGAELVMLRLEDKKTGCPRVQVQEPIASEAVLADLEVVADQVRSEHYPASPGKACHRCSYQTLCPGQPEGRQVIE